MSGFIKHNIHEKKAIFIFTVCLALMPLVDGGELAGQYPGMPSRGAKGNDAQNAAQSLVKIAEIILQEHVIALKPLAADDIQQIEQQLKELKRHTGMLPLDQRAYIDLIKSYIAHFRGNREDALKYARLAAKRAPENTDMSDTEILMALYWEDYEVAKKLLKKKEAGKTAVENVIISWQEKTISTKKTSVSSGPSEPNEPGAPGKLQTSKQLSKWDLSIPQSNKGKPKSTPRRSPDRLVKENGRGLLVGGGSLGALAPVDPTYLQQVEKKSRIAAAQREMSPRYQKKSSYNSILNLLVEYMPYSDLGEDFKKVQLRNVNGSYFYFEPGKGQVLCALLWTLPAGETATRSAASRKRRRPTPRIGGGPNPYAAMRGDSGPGRPDDDLLVEPSDDLFTNADQFKSLFRTYQLMGEKLGTAGKISFVGINFNRLDEGDRERLSGILTDQPWPWSNCLYDEDVNRAQLSGLAPGTPAMMIVGTTGKICYVGPTGGVLPRMILLRELFKAVGAAGMTHSAPPAMTGTSTTPQATGTSKGGVLGLLFGGKKTASAPPEDTPSSPTAEKPSVSSVAKPKVITIEENPSILQARRKLDLAYRYKRLMYNKALQTCDEVLEQWPNSMEAEEAKELIKSILKNRKSLKDQRQKAGKYVGD
ncbi:MAG: hypothetical protein KAJ52_00585 [Sedimentisphaerales bacterium]|nr:hypothetical protein [Sedimentisphaerales bacterium]